MKLLKITYFFLLTNTAVSYEPVLILSLCNFTTLDRFF